jgi:hypothetical protein
MIVIAECVWHGGWCGYYLYPAMRFDPLLDGYYGWTFDIIWMKLWITFGYVKIR